MFSGIVRLSPNVALEGEATQSRDHVTGGFTGSPFVAGYAIDGNFETSVTTGRGACAIAERSPAAWWQVDLLQVYEISKVAITGRKENSDASKRYYGNVSPCRNFNNFFLKRQDQ